RSAASRRRTLHVSSRSALERNDVERRWQSFFDLGIVLKPTPEVIDQTKMHEGKFQCRRPIAQQMRQRCPSADCVEQRAKDSPIKKAEHGVIKLVKSNRRMINIVGQASDEPMAVRDRRNFHQRNSAGEDQIAQQRDVQLQRWTVGKLDGLARTEERADLTKE